MTEFGPCHGCACLSRPCHTTCLHSRPGWCSTEQQRQMRMKLSGIGSKWVAVAAVAMLMAAGSAGAQDVTGAGASFPAPVYAKWADAYNKASGARINYQSV